MKTLLIALGIVLATVVLGGLLGVVRADIAVAAAISIGALASTLLVLTSRSAFAPVGVVTVRRIRAVSHGPDLRAGDGVVRA